MIWRLCYNNLAALESQKGQWEARSNGISRQSRCRSRWCAKVPAVVRHRSDLAISSEQSGRRILPRRQAGRSGRRICASPRICLPRWRTIIRTNWPIEARWQHYFNNQALALAEAGRHADALADLSGCHRRAARNVASESPDSEMMRDLLSKMYYNFGQSLRAERRLERGCRCRASTAGTLAGKRRKIVRRSSGVGGSRIGDSEGVARDVRDWRKP